MIDAVLNLMEQTSRFLTAVMRKLHSSPPDLANELEVWEHIGSNTAQLAIAVNDLGAGE